MSTIFKLVLSCENWHCVSGFVSFADLTWKSFTWDWFIKNYASVIFFFTTDREQLSSDMGE